MSTLATDNFNRADSGTLGANWTDMDAGWGIVSNQANSASIPSCAIWNAVSFPNDQWAQATLKSVGTNTNDGHGVTVRGSGSAGGDCYFAFGFSGGTALWARVGGGYSLIGFDSTSWSIGDVIYLEAQGTTLVVKRNGATIAALTTTDSSIASGSAGVFGFHNPAILDDWSAGDFASGGAISGTATLTFGQSGAITGSGVIAGSTTLTFGQSGAIKGTGALAGSSALTFGQSGAIKGAGALAGTSALTFGQSGAITGAGVIAGSTSLVFGASGTLDQPSGAIAGTATLTFGASGALGGAGALSGSAALLFDASGTFATPLAGTATISFGASGTITNSSPVDSLPLGPMGPIYASGGWHDPKRSRLKPEPEEEPEIEEEPTQPVKKPPISVVPEPPFVDPAAIAALEARLQELQKDLSAEEFIRRQEEEIAIFLMML
jgi:hypothetical protein